MHLSIVSNSILLVGLPEFKNELKADVEVSMKIPLLEILIQSPTRIKSQIWADDGQPRPEDLL